MDQNVPKLSRIIHNTNLMKKGHDKINFFRDPN